MHMTDTPFQFIRRFQFNAGSTNVVLASLIDQEKLPEGTLLQTDFQSSGKGQGDAFWESEKGKNLLFSFLLKPGFLELHKQFYISMVVSLSLVDLFKHYIAPDALRIKWPNDIYIGTKKVAGILIENAIQGDAFQWVVVGVGLNVNQLKFTSNAPNPTSLSLLTNGKQYNLEIILEQFEVAFANRYAQLASGKYEEILHDYYNLMYQKGIKKHYMIKGKHVEGEIMGVNSFGFLHIRSHEMDYELDFKEVIYL